MKTVRVSEVFYSLQGEGFRAGHPSVFVRLSGCDLACGFCLGANTEINTKRGPVKIKDVVVGDDVWAYDEVQQKQTWSRVTCCHVRVADVLSLSLDSSNTRRNRLLITPEHPVWVIGKGWVPAGRVADGDVLMEQDWIQLAYTRPRLKHEMSSEQRQMLSERMKHSNPMREPATAEKAGATYRARGRKGPLGKLWNDPKFRAKSVARLRRVMAMIEQLELPIVRNRGKINIGRRVPDFVVEGKPKVIEVSDPTFYNRESNGYHDKNQEHYSQYGYECLTLYVPAFVKAEHREIVIRKLSSALMEFAYNGRIVQSVTKARRPMEVFNLTTEHGTYFANGVLTHNCDTEFESGREMPLDELNAAIADAKGGAACGWIVWTGGEPALQLTEIAVAFFKERGWKQAIETNGNHPIPPGLDWVACSPKVAEHVLAKNIPQGVDELRYVRHTGQPGIPQPKIPAKHYYLSPRFDGDRVNPANLKHCIKLCLENPNWNLSLQSHKLTKVL